MHVTRSTCLLVGTLAGALAFTTRASAKPGGPIAAPKVHREAKPKGPKHPKVHHRPSPPLPMLVGIENVQLSVGANYVLVTTDLTIPKEDLGPGDLRLFVAFGAPGAPRAFEAKLLDLSQRTPKEPTSLALERVPSCPAHARVVLGRPRMAGMVITLRREHLKTAWSNQNLAIVRLRAVLTPPAHEVDGGHEVLVRLGAPEQLPITVRSISIEPSGTSSTVTKARAQLCGQGADSVPLTVQGASDSQPTLAPILAVRHEDDDLCVRYWVDPDGDAPSSSVPVPVPGRAMTRK